MTDIKVNFVFANYEKKITAASTTNVTGADLRALLAENWPTGIS